MKVIFLDKLHLINLLATYQLNHLTEHCKRHKPCERSFVKELKDVINLLKYEIRQVNSYTPSIHRFCSNTSIECKICGHVIERKRCIYQTRTKIQSFFIFRILFTSQNGSDQFISNFFLMHVLI